MGAVSIDIHKKEREFKELTLSDEKVVRYLIQYRYKVDITYNVGVNINIYEAGDIFELNQELIALYASLDKLIDSINLKEKDRQFLELMFEGYSISDIVEMYDYTRMTAYRTLDRLVNRIVRENNERWYHSMRINKLIISKGKVHSENSTTEWAKNKTR